MVPLRPLNDQFVDLNDQRRCISNLRWQFDRWQFQFSPHFFNFDFSSSICSITIFILQLFQFLNDQRRTTRWISKLQGRSLTIWQVTIWEEGNNFPRHASHLAINAYSQEHVDLDNHRSPCHWLTCPPAHLGDWEVSQAELTLTQNWNRAMTA